MVLKVEEYRIIPYEKKQKCSQNQIVIQKQRTLIHEAKRSKRLRNAARCFDDVSYLTTVLVNDISVIANCYISSSFSFKQTVTS